MGGATPLPDSSLQLLLGEFRERTRSRPRQRWRDARPSLSPTRILTILIYRSALYEPHPVTLHRSQFSISKQIHLQSSHNLRYEPQPVNLCEMRTYRQYYLDFAPKFPFLHQNSL